MHTAQHQPDRPSKPGEEFISSRWWAQFLDRMILRQGKGPRARGKLATLLTPRAGLLRNRGQGAHPRIPSAHSLDSGSIRSAGIYGPKTFDPPWRSYLSWLGWRTTTSSS